MTRGRVNKLIMVSACLLAHNFAFAQKDQAKNGDVVTYESHPETTKLISEMVTEHQFVEADLLQLFKGAERKQSIIDAISRPAEKTLTWKEYRKIFIKDSRIEKGVSFWQANQETLQRAEDEYGVPIEIIVAIIGVETRYGENKGSYRVLDALSTLGFDYPPRATFFRKELKQFLLLSREQTQDPAVLKGSYAGAMGYGQFMPSSFRAYAVDFDGDEIADIWDNPVDAIGSVANYLGRHGWQRDKKVVVRAKVAPDYNAGLINKSLNANQTVGELKSGGFNPVDSYDDDTAAMAMKLNGENGAEFWMGLKNFSVITRYNRSRLYAMAVYQLADNIRKAKTNANQTSSSKTVSSKKSNS